MGRRGEGRGGGEVVLEGEVGGLVRGGGAVRVEFGGCSFESIARGGDRFVGDLLFERARMEEGFCRVLGEDC